MKNVFYFLLLLLPIGWYGCRDRSVPYPPQLYRAERWAEVCPDSALVCLDSLAASLPHLPEEARMYCYLLRIKAEDKLYILHTSDSLINSIVRFYEHWGDDHRLVEALYYQGSVYRDCNDFPRAIRAYRRAAEMEYDHDTLNGRIYGQLAVLYAYQRAYDASMEALRQALICHLKCGNDRGVAFCWRDMARIFDRKNNQLDSADVYYQKAYTLMQQKGFSWMAYDVLAEWADFCHENGKEEQAKDMAYEVLVHRSSSLAASTLAKYYQRANRLDSAEYYSLEVLKDKDVYYRRTAYEVLENISLAQGNPEKARFYGDCYRMLSDSISRMTRTEAIVNMNYEAKKSRPMWQHNVLAGTLLVLVIGMVLMVQFIRNRRKERQSDRENICPVNDAFKHFLTVSRSSELTDEYWSQLTEAINNVYPDFISGLYQYYPKLSLHELHVCLLFKIGISRTQMAELLNRSVSSISNTLSRLYTKITGEKGSVQKMTDFLNKLV